jgi:hypothetical protein
MTPAARGRAISVLRATSLVLVLSAAAGMLLRFPPERYSLYPRCPIYTLFHIQCPGCGATRALAAILRGDLNEAIRLNALFTLVLPILIVWTALYCHKPHDRTHPPRQALYAALIFTVLFTIARNL